MFPYETILVVDKLEFKITMSDIKKAAYIEEEKIYTSRKKEKVHLKNIVASKCPDYPSEYNKYVLRSV